MHYLTLAVRLGLLVLLSPAVRREVAAQVQGGPAPLHFNASSLIQATDSFSLLVGDVQAGSLTRTIKVENNQVKFSQQTESTGASVSVEVVLSASGRPLSVRTNGEVAGMPMTIATTYENGRVKVEGTMPSPSGGRPLKIDAAVDEQTYDESSLPIILAGMGLKEGLKMTLRVFSPLAGNTVEIPVEVVARESLKVTAGTFDVYKVVLRGAQGETLFYFDTGPGHRLVKVKPGGQPVEFELAK